MFSDLDAVQKGHEHMKSYIRRPHSMAWEPPKAAWHVIRWHIHIHIWSLSSLDDTMRTMYAI